MANLLTLQNEVNKAKGYVDAVERSKTNLPPHRYTKLLAFTTERYELAVDACVSAFCTK